MTSEPSGGVGVVRVPGGQDVCHVLLGPPLELVDHYQQGPSEVGQLRRGVFHDLGWTTRASVGLGVDVAGTVDALGPGVEAHTGMTVGTRVATVLAFTPAPSLGYAERVCAPAADLAVVPDALSAVEAATVPLNRLTAAQAIDLLGPADGRSLLVTGAAGAVGGYAARLAGERGFVVTGLARAADAAFVSSTGARLVSAVPTGPTFDVVLDTAVLESAAMTAVRDGGDYVGVAAVAPMSPERGITVHTVTYAPDGPRLRTLLDRSARGDLPVRVAAVVPLAEAARGHELIGAGGLRGRVVLVP